MNYLTIVGRMTKDLEIKNGTKQDGTSWTKGVGCIAEDVWNGREKQAQFLNFQIWGNKAENMSKFVGKGSPVALFGRLRLDNYTDNNGQKKTYTYLDVADFQTFSDKRDVPESKEEASQFSNLNKKAEIIPDNFDDDIPF